MKFFEYGTENPKTLMILCGYLAKWSPGLMPFIEEARKSYHVIVQAYDGFNEDEPQTVYRSVEHEAQCAAVFIAENLGGRVDVLYGISLGGMVGNEILLDKRVKVHTFIADGYTIMPMPVFRSRLIREIYIRGYSAIIYSALTKHRGLLAKAIGRTKASVESSLYTKASRESIRNSVESEIGYRYKFESFNMTDSYIFHGSSELSAARKVHRLKTQRIRFHHKIFPETGHAELIHKDPQVLLSYIDRAYRGGERSKQPQEKP